jgi:hypothetical protein
MLVRLKRPPMSGKYARPTLAAYAKSICYSKGGGGRALHGRFKGEGV